MLVRKASGRFELKIYQIRFSKIRDNWNSVHKQSRESHDGVINVFAKILQNPDGIGKGYFKNLSSKRVYENWHVVKWEDLFF